MKTRLALIALALALPTARPALAQDPAASPAKPAPLPAPPRITRPKTLETPKFVFPEEALAQGHHGTPVHAVTLNPDGSIREIKLITSSRSAVLDKAAGDLLAGTKFSPALDAAGKPIEYTFRAPVEFERWTDDGKGGNLLTYRCADFVRENQWWETAYADTPKAKPSLREVLVGLRFVTNPAARTADGLKNLIAQSDKEWNKAISKCRAKPDQLVIDQFEQKEVLKRLAQTK
ncbi:energy transducer TonB [Novosphingobium sp.]|uniref:energy transducer TonB n=1 Tax=Novosphingobium sp. TaxID=1874826 RepID=UPI0025E3BCA8|nr:energy transducer TonB [Novosphingobium sp.]MCC6926016.1 TonB family protein [Novosphingobium sp.]